PKIFNRSVDIVKHRKKIFTISITLLIIGAIALSFLRLNPGIDFTSGSRIEVLSDETLQTEIIEEDLEQLGLEAKAIVLSGEQNEIAVTRYETVLSEDKIT